MVGQMEQMQQQVTTSIVAAWIGCTKATARTYLEECEREGHLYKRRVAWRGTANVHYWNTSHKARILLDKGFYRDSYYVLLNAKGIVL